MSILEDGSEVLEKDMQQGVEELQDLFLDFAEESAYEIKRTALDGTGDNADTVLLKEYAKSQSPRKTFTSPYEDVIIEIYMIGGHEYALYFDGGVYEAYKCSTVSPMMSEQLSESDYWQRKLSQGNQVSSAV